MKAMILSAGEGRRMRPLTLTKPKPLLAVGGMPLLEHHIRNLKAAGVQALVVNAAYLADQIVAFCDSGRPWAVAIDVSQESEPLETAGGIIQALPLLGDEPFLVVNGDIYCPFPFEKLLSEVLPKLDPKVPAAHLVLVDNPQHNPEGDFALNGGSVTPKTGISDGSTSGLTFSGIAMYTPAFFAGLAPGKRPLKPLLDAGINAGHVTGQYWSGAWEDVGTPERLHAINERFLPY